MCQSVGYSHGDGLLLNVEKLYSGTVTKDETLEAMNMADVTYIATASYCRPQVQEYLQARGLSPTWSTRGSWAMHKQQSIAVDCYVSEAAFRSPLFRQC